jgi:hypothetical protein
MDLMQDLDMIFPTASFHRLIDCFVFATARPLSAAISAALQIITSYQHTNWNLY